MSTLCNMIQRGPWGQSFPTSPVLTEMLSLPSCVHWVEKFLLATILEFYRHMQLLVGPHRGASLPRSCPYNTLYITGCKHLMGGSRGQRKVTWRVTPFGVPSRQRHRGVKGR